MKLSEMNADHVFDTLAVASEEIEKIFNAEELVKRISGMAIKEENEDLTSYGLRKMKDIAFLIFSFSKTYRLGIYKIVAEFKQISAEDVGKLPLFEIWEQIKESLNDELFLSFFPQLRSLVQKESSNTLPKQDPVEQE